MNNAATLLGSIPTGLSDPLLAAYTEIARNYAEHRWEPSELNGGKLCEIVYTIIDGAISGTFLSTPKKPTNMTDACRAIEQRPANLTLVGDRSLRIQIPRLLPFLYEIRNNRGVGHVGGEVSPNFSDATLVFSCANWIMAELIRIFHGVSVTEAQAAVDALVERRHAIVWESDGFKRVLDPTLKASDQALLLLYSTNGWVTSDQLRSWIEYKNKSNFRDLLLTPLHKERLLEHDDAQGRVRLTPRGSKDVEDRLLLKYKV